MTKNILLSALCLSAFLHAGPAYADEMPQRKAGLWELTMTAGQGVPPQTMKQCIDGETDKKMIEMSTDMAGKMGAQCDNNGVKKVGDKYVNETTCQMGPTKIVSKSVFSGDFNSAYSGETTATYNPPLMGMSNMTSKLSAKWLGACETGQVPGDMIMPGGVKMNINQLGMMQPGAGIGAGTGAPGTH